GPAGRIDASTAGATKEPGEPNHAGNAGGRSVWYRWTARSAGTVSFDTVGSTINTLLAVYRGDSLGTLQPVASSDDADGLPTSKVGFAAVADGVYWVAVDGFGGEGGNFVLNWRLASSGPRGGP